MRSPTTVASEFEAVGGLEVGLKRITAAPGRPEKYHSTITGAFPFLVGQRIAEQGTPERMHPNGALHPAPATRTFVLPLAEDAPSGVLR